MLTWFCCTNTKIIIFQLKYKIEMEIWPRTNTVYWLFIKSTINDGFLNMFRFFCNLFIILVYQKKIESPNLIFNKNILQGMPHKYAFTSPSNHNSKVIKNNTQLTYFINFWSCSFFNFINWTSDFNCFTSLHNLIQMNVTFFSFVLTI